MSVAKMWMCNGPLGAWVPCPTSPLTSTDEGVLVETKLLNGGAWVQRSRGTRRKFDMGWLGSISELQPIHDMYDGIYGDGPFYFIDPTSVNNAFPKHWAAPALSGTDGWPTLMKGVVPTYAATSVAASITPPPMLAVYTFPNAIPVFDATTPRATLPIPPTQNLNFRFWGQRTGTGLIRVNAYNRATGALTTTDITPALAGTGATFSGATYSHAEVWLTKTTTAASAVTLAAMLAQVGTGTTAALTWSGGQGHSGVQFSTPLSTSVYRTWGPGWQLINASMSEVGAWLQ